MAQHNSYFDGKVQSVGFARNGRKQTVGVIEPGEFHFGTDAAEEMAITDGSCEVVLDGATATASYGAGTAFEVPAKSGFTIRVKEGICQYVCSFLS